MILAFIQRENRQKLAYIGRINEIEGDKEKGR